MNPNNECKCEPISLVNLSNPKVYTCKHCGLRWQENEDVPWCEKPSTPNPTEECKHCGGVITGLMQHISCKAADIEDKNVEFDTKDVRFNPTTVSYTQEDVDRAKRIVEHAKSISEDWREEFDKRFVDYVKNIHGGIAYAELKYGEQTDVDELKAFIAQVEQKAYNKGRRDEANKDIEDDE